MCNLGGPTELASKSGWQAGCDVVSDSESGNLYGVLHPCFSKNAVGMLHLSLDWANFVRCKRTNSSAPHHFNLFHLHHFVDFLCVFPVVTVGDLDLLYIVLSCTQLRVFDLTQIPVYIQKRVHFTK